MTGVSNHSNSLSLYSSRPGRPPKRASVGLSLAASHLAAAAGHHPQHSLKKHRMDNGDYYENGHLGESSAFSQTTITARNPRRPRTSRVFLPRIIPSVIRASRYACRGAPASCAEGSERGCAPNRSTRTYEWTRGGHALDYCHPCVRSGTR